ncbi:hypothetical protein E2C01_042648 [Portunus trituberculatus]|uniref:Uncharacterized protein n=1 Tax=Portunus trituberculatus TaxID=210409 RepID=A0A5B7FQS2_PORTR|nr:hypothetical protein [Portunus trituberculatus]
MKEPEAGSPKEASSATFSWFSGLDVDGKMEWRRGGWGGRQTRSEKTIMREDFGCAQTAKATQQVCSITSQCR